MSKLKSFAVSALLIAGVCLSCTESPIFPLPNVIGLLITLAATMILARSK